MAMNMFDEARAIRATVELCTVTQDELAKRMHVSQSYVANKLRLLRYSEGMQRRILEKGLSERHARAILRLSDEGAQAIAIERSAAEGLTVSECEALVDRLAEREEKLTADALREKAIRSLSLCADDLIATLRQNGIRATKITEDDEHEMRVTLSVGK